MRINFDLLNRQNQIDFLIKNNIGIDCSGLVFHLLNQMDKERGGAGISSKYLNERKNLPAWRVSWKINADTLTSDEYTKKVKLKDVKSGDMIRLLGGKHVALIVEVNNHEITYIHSSTFTQVEGVHLEKIHILDMSKDLEDQDWREKLKNNHNYGKYTFFPKKGDSIKRVKWWK